MQPIPADVAFRRYDDPPDGEFYDVPRLVTHIDDDAIRTVTQLYLEYFPPGGAILDLMSSWVSHLPPEVEYRRVVGLVPLPGASPRPDLSERWQAALRASWQLP